jgi:hypothetical protein
MNRILEHIEQHRQVLARHPFLTFVQDQSVEPRHRLEFAPCLAPMTMAFSDLMTLGLRDVASTDEKQKVLNAHTYVDDQHWQYFLQDLDTLGMNEKLDFTGALRLLWGEHCTKTRKLTYTFMAQVRGVTPMMRLAILESIEVAADTGFRLLREVGREFTKQTGKQLIYFGQPHQDQEDGHEAMGATSIRSMILAYSWSPEEETEAMRLSDELFACFYGMVDELHAYAQKAREAGPFWPIASTPSAGR